MKKLHFGTMFHFWTFHFTSKFYCRFKFHQYHSSTLDQNQFIQINHHVTSQAPASFTSWQITVKIHCTVLSQSVANNTDAPQWSLIGCEERTLCPLLKHLYPLLDDVSMWNTRLSLSHYFYINAFKGFLKIDRVIQCTVQMETDYSQCYFSFKKSIFRPSSFNLFGTLGTKKNDL